MKSRRRCLVRTEARSPALDEDSHLLLLARKPRATGLQGAPGGRRQEAPRPTAKGRLLTPPCTSATCDTMHTSYRQMSLVFQSVQQERGLSRLYIDLHVFFLIHLAKIYTSCTYMHHNNLNPNLSPILKYYPSTPGTCS